MSSAACVNLDAGKDNEESRAVYGMQSTRSVAATALAACGFQRSNYSAFGSSDAAAEAGIRRSNRISRIVTGVLGFEYARPVDGAPTGTSPIANGTAGLPKRRLTCSVGLAEIVRPKILFCSGDPSHASVTGDGAMLCTFD